MSLDQNPTIKFVRITETAKVPQYQKEGDAGFDLFADNPEEVTLNPRAMVVVPLGIATEIPAGWEVQIRPRSGLAYKNRITIQNAPGTIDSGYRGEWKVALVNEGFAPFTIKPGDRIAQGVIAPSYRVIFAEVNELSASDRGAGGFGSTGTN